MLPYILLLTFSVLMVILSIGFLIGGLIKKIKWMWISSVVSFMVFVILSVAFTFVYIRKSIEYMSSEEFQQETRKSAENTGRIWGNTISGTAEGLNKTLDEDAIAALARKGTIVVGKSVKAVSTGIDDTFTKTEVHADESFEEYNIELGRAEIKKEEDQTGIEIYIKANEDLNGTLEITLYDSENLPIETGEAIIKIDRDKSQIVFTSFKKLNASVENYFVVKYLPN